MAHPTKKSGINPAAHVMQTSRYIHSDILYYSENNNLTFETYKAKNKDFYRKSSGQYTQITAATEFCPHLVSYEIFGTSDLWWRIMEENNMKDILEFRQGVTIKIPGNILF